MIGDLRLKKLHEFFEGYSKEELIWVNGYLSGLVSNGKVNGNADTNGQDHKAVSTKKITLAFGTETGNSKKLATQLAAAGKKHGVIVKLTDLSQYRVADLPKEEFFFVVISTQGEGEPPIPAKKFYDYIHENELSLPNLKFSVLALGDTSYPMFCKTGEDVDARFKAFGAKEVVPIQKCDVDYEEDAQAWFNKVLQVVENQTAVATAVVEPAAAVKKPTGKKHYHGTILTNINLNDRGSRKATYHIEIGTDEPIAYEPGDTIGIVPNNRADVVDRILSLTGIAADKVIVTAKSEGTVKELLLHNLNICYLLTSTIKKYATLTQQEIPDTRMDLVDLLRIYPVKDAAQFEDVVKILMPIAPRLYSVSSSPAAHGENEIHITVAKNAFLSQDEQRWGLCSEFLGDLPVGSPITFYVHKDKNFKLPAADKDVIMIGPGTGVAPFRSFLAERDATGANGRNWFFFGEQHFTTDFLYQTEMQNYVETGVLTNISLAFSRDQQEKVYVQHRIKEKAAEFFQWIDGGASVYISGTKDPMSKDVEKTLLQVIQDHGKKTSEEAHQYLEQLKKEGRYEKDVY
ncbi:diflavin oxidoreductase [Lacibacter sediminis]|uniref:assimilatory sulfite reductase (NADPH) n=1 Tax=Lacibacter sediminis TaxID=2760713 RepID=A0A7G5XJV4_9BACT|nr:flavodoxin domain-containing protein [Lacibacter sediminis]QNA45757.1 flavodoxin domain-containing protein [Lacibacter sediminis]